MKFYIRREHKWLGIGLMFCWYPYDVLGPRRQISAYLGPWIAGLSWAK